MTFKLPDLPYDVNSLEPHIDARTMEKPRRFFGSARNVEDGGSLTQKSVSVGFGYQPNPGRNLLGVGVNWGEPNEDTWGPDLDDQLTAEIFYRWQVSKAFAITPDVQYLVNPALDNETDSLWVLGVRVRGVL